MPIDPLPTIAELEEALARISGDLEHPYALQNRPGILRDTALSNQEILRQQIAAARQGAAQGITRCEWDPAAPTTTGWRVDD